MLAEYEIGLLGLLSIETYLRLRRSGSVAAVDLADGSRIGSTTDGSGESRRDDGGG